MGLIENVGHDDFTQKIAYPVELQARINSFVITAFDDSMTAEMQMRVLRKNIFDNADILKDMIDFVNLTNNNQFGIINNVINEFNKIYQWFLNTALPESLTVILEEWQRSGYLNLIINEAIKSQTDELEKDFIELKNYVGTLGASSTFKGSDTRVNINAKTGMVIGDEWWDTTNSVTLRWNGTAWINVGGIAKLGDKSVKHVNLDLRIVEPENATFFTNNENNLIPVDDFTTGYVDGEGVIQPVGASRVMKNMVNINHSSNYRLQSKTPLTGATIYIVMYNQEGIFTRRFLVNDINDSTVHTFVTGVNDHKFRLSVIAGLEDQLFFHEGTNLLPFEEPYVIDPKYLKLPEYIPQEKQSDLVETVKKHNSTNKTLKAQMVGDRVFSVFQPIGAGKTIKHTFTKDTNDDFVVYDSAIIGTMVGNVFTQTEYIMAGSNKEFAFRLKPTGSTQEIRWFPEHESIGTAFKRNQSITFDGVEKIQEISTQPIVDVESVTLTQEMNLVFPTVTNPVARLDLITTISSDGVTYNGCVTWLQNVDIDRGYIGMLPTLVPQFDTLRTSQWNDYNATLSTGLTNLEQNLSTSFAFINSQGTKDYVLAQTIQYPEKSLRVGEKGIKDPNMIWLEHRSASVQKLYPQVYLNHQAKVGETFNFGSNIFVGIVKLAKQTVY